MIPAVILIAQRYYSQHCDEKLAEVSGYTAPPAPGSVDHQLQIEPLWLRALQPYGAPPSTPIPVTEAEKATPWMIAMSAPEENPDTV